MTWLVRGLLLLFGLTGNWLASALWPWLLWLSICQLWRLALIASVGSLALAQAKNRLLLLFGLIGEVVALIALWS